MTTQQTQESDSPAHGYARLLLELHRLIAAGEGDEDAADEIRDEMDHCWVKMAGQERDRMRGLSHDLYALTEGNVPVVPMSETERRAYQGRAHRLFLEGPNRDADAALSFLREPAPEGTSPDSVFLLQASIWQDLGFPMVSERFLRVASEIAMRSLSGAVA